jgi:hypothetical protein
MMHGNRKRLILSILVCIGVACVQRPGLAQTGDELAAIVKSRVCPKDLRTIDIPTYRHVCGENYDSTMSTHDALECQNKAEHLKNQIYKYNDFIRECRAHGQRGGGTNSGSGSQAGRGSGVQQGGGGGGGLHSHGQRGNGACPSCAAVVHCYDERAACDRPCDQLFAAAKAALYTRMWSPIYARYHACWTNCDAQEDACRARAGRF